MENTPEQKILLVLRHKPRERILLVLEKEQFYPRCSDPRNEMQTKVLHYKRQNASQGAIPAKWVEVTRQLAVPAVRPLVQSLTHSSLLKWSGFEANFTTITPT